MSPVNTVARYIIAARLKGYLNKHQDSVALLTEALEQHPDDVRLLRVRGHRRISYRDFDGAIADLRQAAALLPGVDDEYELYQKNVEPDAINLIIDHDDQVLDHHPKVKDLQGTPDAAPYMSSLHTAVWYHLGVALYLDGQLTEAVPVFENAYGTALHYEGKVAALDWRYMALRRLGRDDEAAAVLQEFGTLADQYDEAGVGYDDRMRLYTGEITPEKLQQTISDNPLILPTIGYGLANWYRYNGRDAEAEQTFDGVLETGYRHAFAYLAVESEREGRGELAR